MQAACHDLHLGPFGLWITSFAVGRSHDSGRVASSLAGDTAMDVRDQQFLIDAVNETYRTRGFPSVCARSHETADDQGSALAVGDSGGSASVIIGWSVAGPTHARHAVPSPFWDEVRCRCLQTSRVRRAAMDVRFEPPLDVWRLPCRTLGAPA